MSSNPSDWRAKVAEENARLGIKITKPRAVAAQPANDEAPTTSKTWNPPQSGRGRHQSGQMNKLETRYAQHLELRRMAGEITKWSFESIKLKLAEKTHLTVDFTVVLPTEAIELHEVKGHWEDDARVKVKCAAKMFPEFQIVGVRRQKNKRVGDEWMFEFFKRGE